MPWSLEQVTRFMEVEIPFNRWLGMEVVPDDEAFVLRIPFRPELVGDRARPALHGGVVSTLIDTAGGGAAFLAVDEGQRVSTVDLVVDYLRPAPLVALVARARAVRKGNRVVLCSVEVTAEGQGEVLALGRAVYNIHGARR